MSRPELKILDWLLRASPSESLPTGSASQQGAKEFRQWFKSCAQTFQSAEYGWAHSVDLAVIGGFNAPQLGYVVAVGYQTALHCLIPDLTYQKFYAFCVAEQQGGHPSKIQSRLTPIEQKSSIDAAKWVLEGEKTFVTGGDQADVLLVAATVGRGHDGRNQLKMVKVDQPTAGLKMSPFELPISLPMLQLVGHGRASLTQVPIRDSDLLPGDAYSTYIKPFRTAEDLHILTAFAGSLFRYALQYQWPEQIKAQILSLIAAQRMLILSDFSAPSVHIALSGLERQIEQLLRDLEPYWPTDSLSTQQQLQAQQQLIKGVIPAQAKRLQAAWRYYERV